MEKIKETLLNPKITVLLGIIGVVLMFYGYYMYNSEFEEIIISTFVIDNILKIGMIIYFILISIRIFFNKGNLTVTNMILFISLIIWDLLLLTAKNFIGFICFFLISLYFINILFKKNTFINNIIFLLAILIYISFNIIQINQHNTAGEINYLYIQYFSYLLITPYFFNYYILLKEEK